MMTRYHKLYRFSTTTGKCEDCGLIENHSNACHDAASVRKIEELYDELDKKNLQVDQMRRVVEAAKVWRYEENADMSKWYALCDAVDALTEKRVRARGSCGHKDGDCSFYPPCPDHS